MKVFRSTVLAVTVMATVSTISYAGWFSKDKPQDYIDNVKHSTLQGCELSSFGIMLNSPNFDNPNWRYYVAQNGTKVVEFTGNITKKLHDSELARVKQHLTDDDYRQILANYMGEVYDAMGNTDAAHASEGVKKAMEYEKTHPIDTGSTDGIMLYTIQYFFDTHYWVIGSKSAIKFVMQGDSFRLYSVENKTWDSNRPNSVIIRICQVK